MTTLGRRTLLTSAAASLAAGLTAAPANAGAATLVRRRLTLPSGVQSGEVTTSRAVLWSRASGVGRMVARVGSGRHAHTLRGGLATPDTDHTAKLHLWGLAPGRDYDAAIWFEDERRAPRRGAARPLRHRVDPAPHRASCGPATRAARGGGSTPTSAGCVGYRAMHETRPDFLIHCGDTVYADGPITAEVVEPDGQVWRNVVTDEVAKVAETLREFRGRHRYNHARRQRAGDVRRRTGARAVGRPRDAQQLVPRTGPRRRPLHRAPRRRARRAGPAGPGRRTCRSRPATARPGDGFVPARIYRKVPRGRHLDVFCLDMRTYKDPNTPGTEQSLTHILGTEQADWLVREADAVPRHLEGRSPPTCRSGSSYPTGR